MLLTCSQITELDNNRNATTEIGKFKLYSYYIHACSSQYIEIYTVVSIQRYIQQSVYRNIYSIVSVLRQKRNMTFLWGLYMHSHRYSLDFSCCIGCTLTFYISICTDLNTAYGMLILLQSLFVLPLYWTSIAVMYCAVFN